MKDLETVILQTKKEVLSRYNVTEQQIDLKYDQIRAYLQDHEVGRSEAFIVYATCARLRNYARAYKKDKLEEKGYGHGV